MNSRGNVIDILFIVIIVFVCALLMIIYSAVGSFINQSMTNSNMRNINMTHLNRAVATVNNMDVIVAGMFLAAMMMSIISAYYSGSHPFFFIFSVIFFLIVLVIAATLSNTFNTIIEGSTFFSAAATNMPYTTFVGRYIPYEAFLAFILISLAFYAGKGGNSGGGGEW